MRLERPRMSPDSGVKRGGISQCFCGKDGVECCVYVYVCFVCVMYSICTVRSDICFGFVLGDRYCSDRSRSIRYTREEGQSVPEHVVYTALHIYVIHTAQETTSYLTTMHPILCRHPPHPLGLSCIVRSCLYLASR